MAYRNRLVTTISAVAAAGLGAFTVGPAQSGYATFSAGDDGLTFDVSVVEGTAWEVRTGCVYTHSGTTLSRGTLESSSTGSAIAFTAAAVLTVTMAASTGDAIKALVSGGGIQTAGEWVSPPSVFRLRLSGTGTVSMDSKNVLGTITLNTFGPVTFAGETNRIEFPFAGTDAEFVRFSMSGSAAVEIL